MGAAQLDLTQEGPRKIIAGNGGQAEAQLLAGLANPGSEFSRSGDRYRALAGVRPHVN
jgi:hypothetical protein